MTRIGSIPGVESVGFGAEPTASVVQRPFELADASNLDANLRPTVGYIGVSSGYFRALGATLISGRNFDESDEALSRPVAIVNQQFANSNWPGENPLGKRLRIFPVILGSPPARWLTVVGVVSNIIQNDRTRQAFDPLVYVPAEGAIAFVRTTIASPGLAGAIRRQIYSADPNLPAPMWPLAEMLNRSYGFERNVTGLLLVFAAIALLVASMGLYAAISHAIRRRFQEIGIRMALGATGHDILTLVFRQSALPVGIGLAFGLVISFGLNRVLKAQLVGVSPVDPPALLAASAVLVLSAAVGCWMPARRATHLDPLIALKHE
jgi:putative ABC transport system permease protein